MRFPKDPSRFEKEKKKKGGPISSINWNVLKGVVAGPFFFLSESSLYFLPNGNATLRECDCPFTIFHFLKEMLCEFVDPSALRTSKIGHNNNNNCRFPSLLPGGNKEGKEREKEREKKGKWGRIDRPQGSVKKRFR